MVENSKFGKDRDDIRVIDIINEIGHANQNGPFTLKGTVARLTSLGEEIRMIVGRKVSEALNRHAGETVDGLKQKREVAQAINDLLDGFGLRISSKTGRGATLLGVPNSDEHDSAGDGRFRLHTAGPRPEWQSSVKFPRIELRLRDMNEKGHRR